MRDEAKEPGYDITRNIAVVGFGAELVDIEDADQFWDMYLAGAQAHRPQPSRDAVPNRVYTEAFHPKTPISEPL